MVLIKIFTHLVVSTQEDFHFQRFVVNCDVPFLKHTVDLMENICKAFLKGLTWLATIYHCYCVISCTYLSRLNNKC